MYNLGERIWGYSDGDPYEDNGQFSGLRFNPAPGVLQAIEDLVGDLDRAHKNIESASETLQGINKGISWSGAASDGFRAKIQPLPKLLDTAGKSFEHARHALDAWQSHLTAMQAAANSYESDAKTARKRAERADNNPDLEIFGGLGPSVMSDAEFESAKERYDQAVNEQNYARDQLSVIVEAAKKIRSQHEELAANTASALSEAAKEAPEGPGFFDDLLRGFKDLAKAIGDFEQLLGRWVKEHANAIAAIGDVLSTVSTITGLVGFCFPPAEEVMAPVSGLSSLAALALHKTAQSVAGKDVVSDRTLLEDELGVASFGLSNAAKVAGKVSGAILESKVDELGKAAGWGSTGKTLVDWKHDLTSLGYFLPSNKGEAIAVGGSMLLGGPMAPMVNLGIAFKHAWEKGSEKDADASQHAPG
ncbi:putative T7SS-secreted protein [Streptomyces sp. CT34]|uniref:putative T7SS-secreted protein n=1 Tax=Streptomyces sp. CT34 TaxID=1553907 RepID=UPI0012FED587|nr:hypothetical protein [Streptomyces sp. CT34]